MVTKNKNALSRKRRQKKRWNNNDVKWLVIHEKDRKERQNKKNRNDGDLKQQHLKGQKQDKTEENNDNDVRLSMIQEGKK